MTDLKAEFEPQGIKVYPISAVTGQGVRELLFHIKELLDSVRRKRIVFEQEFFPEDMLSMRIFRLPYRLRGRSRKYSCGRTYDRKNAWLYQSGF